MIKRILQFTMSIIVVFLLGCGVKDTIAPEIIETNPRNGVQNVDPSLQEISVTFSESMADKSWSWSYEDKNKFPEMTGQSYYSENMTRNIVPVKLEPSKEYVIWINTVNYTGFRDKTVIED